MVDKVCSFSYYVLCLTTENVFMGIQLFDAKIKRSI